MATVQDPPPIEHTAADYLRVLRDLRPRTRAELASALGHSRSTTTVRLDELLSLGLVRPVGEAPSSGGRPPTVFAFNPDARLVGAIDLGATHTHLAVANLAGRLELESSLSVDLRQGPRTILDLVSRELVMLTKRTAGEGVQLASIGVGLPGPVDYGSGRPLRPPLMPGWDGYDVAGHLTKRLRVARVVVDNDVNLMAAGEYQRYYPTSKHLLFIKVATGIGCGVISDGVLRRGAQGAACDIGHVAVPGGPDVPCRCGSTGCLEAVAGGAAIGARLNHFGRSVSTNADILALVRSGDGLALRALTDAGQMIGRVLASCVSLLNPAVIVVGGSLGAADGHLLPQIRQVVYGRSLPLATAQLTIAASHTRQRAGVLGAADAAIEALLHDSSLIALAGNGQHRVAMHPQ